MTLKFLINIFCLLALVCSMKAIVVGIFFLDSFNTREIYGIEHKGVKWFLLFVFPLQGLFTTKDNVVVKNEYINVLNAFKMAELFIVWMFFIVSIIRIENKIFKYNSTENTDLCHWTLKYFFLMNNLDSKILERRKCMTLLIRSRNILIRIRMSKV